MRSNKWRLDSSSALRSPRFYTNFAGRRPTKIDGGGGPSANCSARQFHEGRDKLNPAAVVILYSDS